MRKNHKLKIKENIHNTPIIKTSFQVGPKIVVIIDKIIAEKLGIIEGTFLEQEITDDGKILMSIRRF